MNDPVKCKECGTWWRSNEHRCPAPPAKPYKQLEFEYEYDWKTQTGKYPTAIPHILNVTCKYCGHHAKVSVPHKCSPYKDYARSQFEPSMYINKKRVKEYGSSKEKYNTDKDNW